MELTSNFVDTSLQTQLLHDNKKKKKNSLNDKICNIVIDEDNFIQELLISIN